MTKQIDIKELIPFMKDGWVAMDRDGKWLYFEEKPTQTVGSWSTYPFKFYILSELINIAPVDDWTKSLIKVGGDESQSNLCTTGELENDNAR